VTSQNNSTGESGKERWRMTEHQPDKEQNKNNKGAHDKPARRRCLSCQKAFPSEGAHHRICDNCKTLQGWANGNPSFCSHRPNAANDNF
jgi:hypothetical protein